VDLCVAHHPVFEKFQPLTITTRQEFTDGAYGSAPLLNPVPSFDEEYFEWIDVLESVDRAHGSYTMIELGAGYGRWSVRGALAARRRGLDVRLVAVEGEPQHFAWLKLHLADNGIDPEQHWLIDAAVSDSEGETFFHAGKPREWYGQSISSQDTGYLIRKVTLVSILEVLAGPVDLIDLDVQGEEFKIVWASIDALNAKVKRLHIGTHSLDIEEGLRTLLKAQGWQCLADFSLARTNDTPYGSISFVDGVQSWVNLRL
jgi:FkbM family methyltransferase